MVRIIKIFMIMAMALFFSIIAFDNIFDYQANWLFVMHVLSMDTTFKDPAIMYRAITNPALQHFAYNAIIVWEALTALVLWFGAVVLWLRRNNDNFNKAKRMAILGLFMGFVLYMVGFLIIGGEWFAMWQSTVWNGQAKAGMFLDFILLILIFVAMKDKKLYS